MHVFYIVIFNTEQKLTKVALAPHTTDVGIKNEDECGTKVTYLAKWLWLCLELKLEWSWVWNREELNASCLVLTERFRFIISNIICIF